MEIPVSITIVNGPFKLRYFVIMGNLKQIVVLALAVLSRTESIAARPPLSGRLLHPRYINDSFLVKNEYDYVIVGGGTAGLTVADRLSEDGSGKNCTGVCTGGQYCSMQVADTRV